MHNAFPPISMRSIDLPGVLIAVEGFDGTGKTTLMHYLRSQFRKEGEEIISIKFPTPSIKNSRLFRNYCAEFPPKYLSALAAQTLRMAHRLQETKSLITPALAAGKVVLVEKYLCGLHAAIERYQLPQVWFAELCTQLWRPTVWVLLYAPADVCLDRLKKRPNDPDANRDVEEIERPLKKSLELANRHEIMILDTSILSLHECWNNIHQKMLQTKPF